MATDSQTGSCLNARLKPAFVPGSGVARESYVYGIDASDRIVAVSESWIRFAADNDAPALATSSVIARPPAASSC
jgi:hypothetical protein